MDSKLAAERPETPTADIDLWEEGWEEIPRVCRAGSDTPLSFAQQRLWILDQLQPGIAAYNVPLALRLSGSLSVDVLRASLAHILSRHQVLRARFPGRLSGAPPTLECVSVAESASPECEALRLAEQEARVPFDLACGPVLRPLLISIAPDDHLLVFVFHHIAVDGWSLGVFCAELSEFYTARLEGRQGAVADPPIQYSDYASWQVSQQQAGAFDPHLQYWKRKLAGVEPLELPVGRPRSAVQTFQGANEAFDLPRELT